MNNYKITMKKPAILILLVSFIFRCSGPVKDTSGQVQTYGNTTDRTGLSAEKIDGSSTYEIYFTLEKPAVCMTIEIETVLLQKSFPLQKIPKTTYFIIEKKLKIPHMKSSHENNYTPLGKNFNNDWEVFSPVKVCTNKNDPLSVIDTSEYRIRFTAFEKQQLYYIITIACESKIVFKE